MLSTFFDVFSRSVGTNDLACHVQKLKSLFLFWWHVASMSFLRKEATFLRPCMCANVYILASCLIVALAAYKILGWILIFLQNIVSCHLAACFPLEKSKVILVSDPLCVIYFFFLLEAPRISS